MSAIKLHPFPTEPPKVCCFCSKKHKSKPWCYGYVYYAVNRTSYSPYNKAHEEWMYRPDKTMLVEVVRLADTESSVVTFNPGDGDVMYTLPFATNPTTPIETIRMWLTFA